jgi:D-glycerate 3-kinase
MQDMKHKNQQSLPAASEQLQHTLWPVFEQILQQELIKPGPRLRVNFEKYYLPLAQWIADEHQKTPLVIGINGSQGSGKSTLSKILAELLQHGFNKSVVAISIDDFYKTRQQRQDMASQIHPLFITRGVPGTHDISLGLSVLSRLKQKNTTVTLPLFDKTIDDRKPQNEWSQTTQETDIILFEGWCVGSIPEDEEALAQCINTLEENEDTDAKWRRGINQQLATGYQTLFSLIDKLIMLKIPEFSKVYEWRSLQEKKLIQNISSTTRLTMSEQELKRFILHFERVTRHTLREMPERADIILEIDHDHQISGTIIR